MMTGLVTSRRCRRSPRSTGPVAAHPAAASAGENPGRGTCGSVLGSQPLGASRSVCGLPKFGAPYGGACKGSPHLLGVYVGGPLMCVNPHEGLEVAPNFEPGFREASLNWPTEKQSGVRWSRIGGNRGTQVPAKMPSFYWFRLVSWKFNPNSNGRDV